MRDLHFVLGNERRKVSSRYHVLVVLSIMAFAFSPVNAQDAAQNFYTQGKESFEHKKYDDALKYFNYSLQANQKYVPSLVYRAIAYVYLRQPENAIADCNSVIALKTLNGKPAAEVYKIRADAQTENKQFKLAEQDYTSAIALDSTNAEYFRSRGGVRGGLKNYQGAIADYGSAIALNPTYSPDDYWYRAKIYAIGNQHEKALKDFDKAIEQSRGANIHMIINRAQSYLQLGKYDKTVADCTRALEHLKTDTNVQKETYDAYKARIAAYEKMGKKDLAKRDQVLMSQLDVAQF
jgi:tetratricopeptide (TPR) repeat protein